MRHTLLVRKYDLDEITKTITDYIDQCEGKAWIDIAQNIALVFAWEYEDYQPQMCKISATTPGFYYVSITLNHKVRT